MGKKVIFSADDFAKCPQTDNAILRGFETGVLTSTCIMPNGDNYQNAIKMLVSDFSTDFKNGGLGFHFNIIEGKSLLNKENGSFLCDSDGNYNRNYFYMILKSFDKTFLEEFEQEFRSQIEKLSEDARKHGFRIDHVNSHVHVHGIPVLFDLTCRLSKEYGIDCIRTQYEDFYFHSFKKYAQTGFCNIFLNVLKNLLLKIFTLMNLKTLKKYNMKTNEKFVGLLFTGYMDEEAVLKGINSAKVKQGAVEVLVHPYVYEEAVKADKNKQNEYEIVNNENFRTICEENGAEFVNFSRISV